MNQKCKVCGEPAAGFHFGAFTCEGCKSFFGRSYNNMNSINDCKNNGECIINKKNRTACKSCRLRKCLLVGMSKSGSRYGRRSNWFKIHCLLQEQQQQAQSHTAQNVQPPPHHLAPPFPPHIFPALVRPRSKEELSLLGMDDYKRAGSPDSHRSGSSPKQDEKARISARPMDRPMTPNQESSFVPLQLTNLTLPHPFHHPAFLTPPPFSPFAANHLLFPGGFHPAMYHRNFLEHAAYRNNNNDVRVDDHNADSSKLLILDEVLKAQQRPKLPVPRSPRSSCSPRDEDSFSERQFIPTPPKERRTSESPLQENPMDLSVKSDASSARRRSDDTEVAEDIDSGSNVGSGSEEEDVPYDQVKRIKLQHPLDLTTKV